MSYAELLLSPEWRNRRLTILYRDKLTCQNCSNNEILPNLNISQGLLTSSVNTDNLCYLLVGQYRTNTSRINRVSSFLKKGITFWEDNIIRNHILVYHENIESNIIKPIAARRILNQEAVYSNNLPIVLNPIKNPAKANWIYNGTLHVHHKYYKIGLLPWEYDNEALTTLCWSCHENLHKSTLVPVLDRNGITINQYTPCKRCHGAGVFPEYSHVDHGICFECGGAKYYELMI